MKNVWVVLAMALFGTACGAGDSDREAAINDVIDEIGFNRGEAECAIDRLLDEFGSLDFVDDPDKLNDEETFRAGEILLECSGGPASVPSSGNTETTGTDTASAPSATDSGTAATDTDDESQTDPPTADQDSPPATGEGGYWTAAQLCTLFDDDQVTNLFGTSAPAVAFEQFQLDDDSICSWPDPDSSEVLPPALILVRQQLNDGQDIQFGDVVNIAGADYGDYRPAWLPGRDFLEVRADDQWIYFDYLSNTPGAYDLVLGAATDWVSRQTGVR